MIGVLVDSLITSSFTPIIKYSNYPIFHSEKRINKKKFFPESSRIFTNLSPCGLIGQQEGRLPYGKGKRILHRGSGMKL
ncbi:MAG: hypothetical protein R6X11_08270 [Desulfonatronovibrio sp.]